MCRKLKATKRAKQEAAQPVLLSVKSNIPKGGWTHENFVGSRRVRLNGDLAKVSRYARLRGANKLTRPLSDLLTDQVEAIIEGATRRAELMYGVRAGGAFVPSISEDAHEALWADAIEKELQAGDITLSRVLSPSIEEVAEYAFKGTNVLILGTGGKSVRMDKSFFGPRWLRRIAETVSGITDSTRTRLLRVIKKAIRAGKNFFEVSEEVKKKLPQIATNRVPTIVRTEMGRASDKGTSVAMKQSGTVTHMSVVGCGSIERNAPHFMGIPTCNIQNVPVEYEGGVDFHPNHTGSWIVSGFRKEDGSVPNLAMRAGGPYNR